MLWGSLTVTVPSGYAGLTFHVWRRCRSDDPIERLLQAPWNGSMNRQTEQMETLEVLSSNLLKINMD